MLIIYLYLFGVVFFEEGTKNSDSFFLSLSLSTEMWLGLNVAAEKERLHHLSMACYNDPERHW